MTKHKSEKNTLLMSVLMSSPGPLVVGLGLLAGRSATQIADFVRRSSELLAIIMAFAIYQLTNRDGRYDGEKKQRLERYANRFVGAMMCLGGSIMLILAFASSGEDAGNVIPGLSIAVLGVIANSLFWRKYTRLNRQEPNAIMKVQAALYRAKTLVDGCVTVALASVALFPGTEISGWLDRIGSVIVALYLIWSGYKVIAGSREAVKAPA